MVWKRANQIPYNFRSVQERKSFEKFYHVKTELKPPRPLKWYVSPTLMKNGLYTLQTALEGKDRTCLIARFDGLPLWVTPWESYAGRMSRASFKQAIRKFGQYINARVVEVKPLKTENDFRPSEIIICVYSIINGLKVKTSRNGFDQVLDKYMYALHLQSGVQNILYEPPVKVLADNLHKYKYCAFTEDPQKIRELLSGKKKIEEFKNYMIFGDKGINQ